MEHKLHGLCVLGKCASTNILLSHNPRGRKTGMKKEGYYSSGQLANIAHVTKKTLRYYDAHGYLKPSYVNESGARFYTDQDLRKLQQLLFFKYLGFSLEDIKEMMLDGTKEETLVDSLQLQLYFLENKLEQMKLVEETLRNTIQMVEKKEPVEWNRLLKQIDITGLENSLKQQYKNASNITSRISLHKQFSANAQGWFPWIFEQCGIQPGMKVLELGCGDGSFLQENKERLPENLVYIASDVSLGMLRDMEKQLGAPDERIKLQQIDMQQIPYPEASIDLVIANHVLFYAENIPQAVQEMYRVLRPGGRLILGTYGSGHMQEISTLAKAFDDRIILAAEDLYEIFGKENGTEILATVFPKVEWVEYEDHLLVTDAEALLSYILSCHGNQNQYLLDRYREFLAYLEKATKKGFHVTKEAGIFCAVK